MRVPLLKARCQLRQKEIAQRDRRAHAQHAKLIPIAQPLFHAVQRFNDVQRLGIQPRRALSAANTAADALKQAHAVIMLQFLNSAADGGLGHVQLLRGAGDALRLINADEDLHVADGHGVLQFIIIMICIQ